MIVGVCKVDVYPLGPDQLQVVVPDPVAVADKSNDEFAQVRIPPLAAAAVTSIEETVTTRDASRNQPVADGSEVVPSAVVTLPVRIGQSGEAYK